jgi:diguanylate cyclase (GGDEF)-like protein
MIKTLKLASTTPMHSIPMTEVAPNAIKILIVEDELIVAENLAKHLTKQGYAIVNIVDSGADAIAESQRHNPDIVLMDITLQGDIDGIQAAEIIGRQCQAPIVYMTAHADDATLERAKHTGPYGYLVKPFNPSNLKATIEVALEKHRLEVTTQTAQSRQLAAVQQQIQDLRQRDPLTKLLSGTGLKQHFQTLTTQYAAAVETFPTLMIPFLCLRIDACERFRGYGLSFSQHIISQVAERIQRLLGTADTSARIDTYEFAILLNPVTSKLQISQIAQQLLSEIAQPLVYNGHEFFLSATIGGSLYPHHGLRFSELLAYAQSSVNRLQAKGNNQYQLYSAVLDQCPSLQHLSIESALYHALERQELSLVYQAQTDFRTGAVVSTEALLRWQHPTLGQIPPNEFIPLAESTGLIHSIGKWVIATACQQLRHWHQHGLENLRMAINISSLQLRDPTLHHYVSRCLVDNQLAPHALELELTESLLVEDTAETNRCIHLLKAVGVDIAIDDFGTGYSSLKYLQQIPVDNIKLDRTFVQNIHHASTKNADIVGAIINIARALGAQVTAEGVASESEYQFLKAADVDIAQGYFITPPLTAPHFMQWLQGRSPG